jgi:hypothetical protein
LCRSVLPHEHDLVRICRVLEIETLRFPLRLHDDPSLSQKWAAIFTLMRSNFLRAVIAPLLVLALGSGAMQFTDLSVAGASTRTSFCSALLKVLSTDANRVVQSLDPKINEKPQRPLTASMDVSLSKLILGVNSADTTSPSQASKSVLRIYLKRLTNSRSPLSVIKVVWAFDSKGSRSSLLACRGQYKHIVSLIAPFGPAPS